ncbi:hypothetical protein Enr13x_39160 [Stieleria neptunia]|uniref:Uncharacterized protein n=1 Tax=Stieleria neptunia TaxID=2527979 RepID=A0A518HT69_9BACT|nr:hypothetical protein [Stieleria neptunia]QDV44055.1 hypothetical protein Enr13x_39160 [Stieleria neptunia]
MEILNAFRSCDSIPSKTKPIAEDRHWLIACNPGVDSIRQFAAEH